MPKRRQIILEVSGWADTHNRTTRNPPGSVLKAEDVVFRRGGLVEQRPIETLAHLSTAELDYDPHAFVNFDDDLLIIAEDGANDWRMEWWSDVDAADEWGTNTPVSSGMGHDETAGAPSPSMLLQYTRHAEMRDNLYLNGREGVLRLGAAGETTAYEAGVSPPPGIDMEAGALAGTAVAVGDQVAYRAVLVQKDSNGNKWTSAPSSRMRYHNSGGATADSLPTVLLPPTAVVGDVIELYRSPAIGYDVDIIPADEMYLAYEFVLTSSEITAGWVGFQDARTDNQLGKALYTNPSRESILQRNSKPPRARDLAVFRGCMFYANVLGPQRISLTFTIDASDLAGQADGIGVRSLTGDFSNGNATVTSVSDMSGVQVGQMMASAAAPIPLGAIVTAIDVPGSEITFDTDATSTASTEGFDVTDTIRVESATEDVYYPVEHWAYLVNQINGIDRGPSYGLGSADVLAYIGGRKDLTYDNTADPVEDEYTLWLEERYKDAGAFEVYATHGDEYEPPIPLPTESDGEPSSADDNPHAVMWSKLDQPEHVPELNYIPIGSKRQPIQRIIPTRDALYIFKKDGIYALSGVGPASGWRVDPVDLDKIVHSPRAVASLNGAVYAATNQGVIRLQGGQLANVSGQIWDEIDAYLLDTSDSASLRAAVLPFHGELFLSIGSVRSFVFNERTGLWSDWDGRSEVDEAVEGSADGKSLWWGSSGGGGFSIYQLGDSVGDTTPVAESINITDVATTSNPRQWVVTIDSGSVDVFDPIDLEWIVVDEESSTVFTVEAIEPAGAPATAPVPGAASVYPAYRSRLRFALDGGDPTLPKHWGSVVLSFQEFVYVPGIRVSWTSSQSDGAIIESRFRLFNQHSAFGEARGRRSIVFRVPREHARSAELFMEVSIYTSSGGWQLTSVSADYVPLATRANALVSPNYAGDAG